MTRSHSYVKTFIQIHLKVILYRPYVLMIIRNIYFWCLLISRSCVDANSFWFSTGADETILVTIWHYKSCVLGSRWGLNFHPLNLQPTWQTRPRCDQSLFLIYPTLHCKSVQCIEVERFLLWAVKCHYSLNIYGQWSVEKPFIDDRHKWLMLSVL